MAQGLVPRCSRTFQWRDDTLVTSWVTHAEVSSLALAKALATAHERLVDNRLALDAQSSPPS